MIRHLSPVFPLSIVLVLDSDVLDICNTILATHQAPYCDSLCRKSPACYRKDETRGTAWSLVRHFLSTGGCFLMLSDLISAGCSSSIFVAVISWNLICSEEL